jgi:hypothetical protein
MVETVVSKGETGTLHNSHGLPHIPPNFFGISFGLAGLAEVWTLGAPILQVSVSSVAFSLVSPRSYGSVLS